MTDVDQVAQLTALARMPILLQLLAEVAKTKEQRDALETVLRTVDDPALRNTRGGREVTVTSAAGVELGGACIPAPSLEAAITDVDKWDAWVAANHKEAFIKVEDPEWRKGTLAQVLANAKKDQRVLRKEGYPAGPAELVARLAEGEVVPGVTIRMRPHTSMRVTTTREGVDLMRKILESGPLKAIETGQSKPDLVPPAGDGPSASRWGFDHIAPLVPDTVPGDTGGV